MVDDDGGEVKGEKFQGLKLKLCSDGVKDFIKLLKGNFERELLHLYLCTSFKCLELLDAWNFR